MFADINECGATGTNNCAGTATCDNTVGSFTCRCNPGYTGDGVTCTGEELQIISCYEMRIEWKQKVKLKYKLKWIF